MITFPEYAPDRSRLDPAVTDTATNVVPKAGGYGPFPQQSIVSSALAAVPRGAFLARDNAGAYSIFAFTAGKAYKFNTSTSGWDDVTKAATTYGLPASEAWAVEQFGTQVIASNSFDENQVFTLGSSTEFADLGGGSPKALRNTVVSEFFVVGRTDDYGINSIAWSGINDATYWTPGRRASDYQVFPDGGEVLGVIGAERGGLVFQDSAIREMVFNPSSPFIFNFEKTDESKTIIAPRGIVRAGGQIFYIALEGFYRYGRPSAPIGNERVDRFFAEDVNQSYIWQTQASADPINHKVYWRYTSNDSNSAEATDRVLVYDYALDRWSVMNIDLTWLFPAVTPGETLESLDALGYTLDTLPASLDSRFWAGGVPLIGGFDTSYRLVFFSGAPMAATVGTGDVMLLSPRRAFVNGWRPVTDAPSISGRVGVRDWTGGNLTWKTSYDVLRTGEIPARANGRTHRFEASISAGTQWSYLHGLDPSSVTDGGNQ